MFTLQTEIMRHMLNLAKDMASSDLFESRKKLEEYPLCGDPNVFDHIMRVRAVQDRAACKTPSSPPGSG